MDYSKLTVSSAPSCGSANLENAVFCPTSLFDADDLMLLPPPSTSLILPRKLFEGTRTYFSGMLFCFSTASLLSCLSKFLRESKFWLSFIRHQSSVFGSLSFSFET